VIGPIFAVVLAAAPESYVDQGRRLFHDPGLGKNGVACANCHSTVESEVEMGDGLIRAGHTLWGVARRPHWRGDSRRTAYPSLGDAVEVCVKLFHGAATLDPLDRQRLVSYLESISPKRGQPPLQLQPALEANLDYDRPKYRGGDPDRGRALFFRACNACHPRGGVGLGPSLFGKSAVQVVLKSREGNGLLRGSRQPGAWMPFYGRDRLADDKLADIAAFVAVLAGPEPPS